MALDRRRLLGGLAATGVAALVGCSNDDKAGAAPTTDAPSSSSPPKTTPSASDTPSPTQAPKPRLDRVVATNLNVPWGIAFLDSGEALVSERDTAKIVRVAPNGSTNTVGTVPGVDTRAGGSGEGGLLGIALAPDHKHVYAYHSTASDNRVVRMSLSGNTLGDPATVLTGIPRNVHHNGGRIVFGPDGMLYVSTGDALQSDRAQDKGSLGGKILRITADGGAAPGNPFDNEVYSYGHRNVEGLAFDADDRLWATEFGDSETDELNLIKAGRNYGWPEVEGRSDNSDFVNPKATWSTDECSPSGLAIVRSTAFLGALQGQCVFAVPLSGTHAGEAERLFGDEHGRLRTVVAAPGGALWVTTSNTDGRASPDSKDDRILRVTLG